MEDWYEIIEPEVRKLVKLLRDNGFNTTCSCGHEMNVEGQFSTDGEIQRLDSLLFNCGYENYTLTFEMERKNGHGYFTWIIKLN